MCCPRGEEGDRPYALLRSFKGEAFAREAGLRQAVVACLNMMAAMVMGLLSEEWRGARDQLGPRLMAGKRDTVIIPVCGPSRVWLELARSQGRSQGQSCGSWIVAEIVRAMSDGQRRVWCPCARASSGPHWLTGSPHGSPKCKLRDWPIGLGVLSLAPSSRLSVSVYPAPATTTR